MRLTAPTPNTVAFVARAAAIAEKSDRDPEEVTRAVMAHVPDVWVAWHDTNPAAVLGLVEPEPGFWQIYCFHTDEFPAVILPLTRFIRRTLIPSLFNERGAQRLEGYASPNDHAIRRWMKLCGGRQEGWREGRVVYVVDSQNAHV